eukprot:GEMP01010030.1.p1 GENE.GEMP01010030.1~~GEMP01010030.1.p1  ORF type:complete len:959 (+),score=156.54 GEMP01010030.1:51-2927(+)
MFTALFGKPKAAKIHLQPQSILEMSMPVQVQRTAEADSILTYTFERKTILQILSVTDDFLHVRDIVDHRGYIDRAKFENALGPISEDWSKFLYGRRAKTPIISAFEYATAGMMGETKEVLSLTIDQDLNSKVVKVVEKTTPFRVLRRNIGSRRCEVKLLTQESRVGWISLLTRAGVPTCDHMSRQNPMLQGVIDPHTSIQIGQSMSLTKPVQLTKGEDTLELIKTLPIHTAVAIKRFGNKYPLRIKIGVTHESVDGWISMIDDTGTDVLGLEQYPADLLYQVSTLCSSDDVGAFAKLGLIDLNHTCGENNETPLMLASSHGSANIVDYLLNRGASVSALSSLGFTAMNYVKTNPNKNVCVALLNARADINHVDRKGCSLLMDLAGQKPDDAIIPTLKLLLERLADPNLLDTSGTTALDMARQTQWEEAVKLMRAFSGRGGTKGKVFSPRARATGAKLSAGGESPMSVVSAQSGRTPSDNFGARNIMMRLSQDGAGDAEEVNQVADSTAINKTVSTHSVCSVASTSIMLAPLEVPVHRGVTSDRSPKHVKQSGVDGKGKGARISVIKPENGGEGKEPEQSELERLPLETLLEKRKNLYDEEISAVKKLASVTEIDQVRRNRISVNKALYSRSGNIRLICRTLPTSKPSKAVELLDDGATVKLLKKEVNPYIFDRTFDASATQDDIFENSIRSQTQHVFDGNNSAVITVGTMRAGKSYTMFGNVDNQREHGLALRAIAELLHVAASLRGTRTVEISFVLGELFKNSWYDLTAMAPVSYFKELEMRSLASLGDASNALRAGFQARQVLLSNEDDDDSKGPQYSSVFLQILVDTTHKSTKQKTSGKYTFVDTGSSDISKTRGGSGSFANRALEHLGQVLKEVKSRGKQVAYTENKMTMPFEKAPMSTPSETVVIACVSTEEKHITGTERTLEFMKAVQGPKRPALQLSGSRSFQRQSSPRRD